MTNLSHICYQQANCRGWMEVATSAVYDYCCTSIFVDTYITSRKCGVDFSHSTWGLDAPDRTYQPLRIRVQSVTSVIPLTNHKSDDSDKLCEPTSSKVKHTNNELLLGLSVPIVYVQYIANTVTSC
jgi:hypothetical protein